MTTLLRSKLKDAGANPKGVHVVFRELVRERPNGYVYDGMLVVQERNGSNTPTVHYARGTDLSGTREGAGGIGGLLARSHGYSSGNWSTRHFYHADGNGNVTAMMNTSQTLSATYKYDAFGKLRSSSGTMSGANLYRFSSKEFHIKSERPPARAAKPLRRVIAADFGTGGRTPWTRRAQRSTRSI